MLVGSSGGAHPSAWASFMGSFGALDPRSEGTASELMWAYSEAALVTIVCNVFQCLLPVTDANPNPS